MVRVSVQGNVEGDSSEGAVAVHVSQSGEQTRRLCAVAVGGNAGQLGEKVLSGVAVGGAGDGVDGVAYDVVAYRENGASECLRAGGCARPESGDEVVDVLQVLGLPGVVVFSCVVNDLGDAPVELFAQLRVRSNQVGQLCAVAQDRPPVEHPSHRDWRRAWICDYPSVVRAQ